MIEQGKPKPPPVSNQAAIAALDASIEARARKSITAQAPLNYDPVTGKLSIYVPADPSIAVLDRKVGTLQSALAQIESDVVDLRSTPPAITTISTGSDTIPMVATESISAFSAVTITGKVADSNNAAHLGKVIGLAPAAIADGFSGDVQTTWLIDNPAWQWSAGDRIYLNGQGFSTVPGGLFVQAVGVAKTPTTIFIEIEPSILL